MVPLVTTLGVCQMGWGVIRAPGANVRRRHRISPLGLASGRSRGEPGWLGGAVVEGAKKGTGKMEAGALLAPVPLGREISWYGGVSRSSRVASIVRRQTVTTLTR
jgi:hypothetical protein